MSNIIPFPRPVPPDCEACSLGLMLSTGDVFCTVYNEAILEPAYAAEDCPTYTPS